LQPVARTVQENPEFFGDYPAGTDVLWIAANYLEAAVNELS